MIFFVEFTNASWARPASVTLAFSFCGLLNIDPVRHSHCRRSPTNSRCLAIDTRSCWKLFHTFGDNFSQLHHLLSQLAVFRNIALNAIAVGV